MPRCAHRSSSVSWAGALPDEAVVFLLELPLWPRASSHRLSSVAATRRFPPDRRPDSGVRPARRRSGPAAAAAASAPRAARAPARCRHEPGGSRRSPPARAHAAIPAGRPDRRSPARPARSNAARWLPHTGGYTRTGPCHARGKTPAYVDHNFRRPVRRAGRRPVSRDTRRTRSIAVLLDTLSVFQVLIPVNVRGETVFDQHLPSLHRYPGAVTMVGSGSAAGIRRAGDRTRTLPRRWDGAASGRASGSMAVAIPIAPSWAPSWVGSATGYRAWISQ